MYVLHLQIEGKPVYYNTWVKHNIFYVQDLLLDEGYIANKNFRVNKYGITFKFFEYESLMHAISKIEINNIYRKLPEITTKDIYWELQNDQLVNSFGKKNQNLT